VRLRIVRDRYLGYEVQVWRWWFPFWIQAGDVNTFSSVESAEKWAVGVQKPVVKYLDRMKS